jgi:hypothetical protein
MIKLPLYRLGLRGEKGKDLEQARRDHVLKKGWASKMIRNLLRRDHGMFEAKGRLPFGGSCMVAARRIVKNHH